MPNRGPGSVWKDAWRSFCNRHRPADKDIAGHSGSVAQGWYDTEVRMIVIACPEARGSDHRRPPSPCSRRCSKWQSLGFAEVARRSVGRLSNPGRTMRMNRSRFSLPTTWGHGASPVPMRSLHCRAIPAVLRVKHAAAVALARMQPAAATTNHSRSFPRRVIWRHATPRRWTCSCQFEARRRSSSRIADRRSTRSRSCVPGPGASPASKGGRLLSEALEGVKLHPAVLASVSTFHRDTGLLPDGLAEMFRRRQQPVRSAAELLTEDLDASLRMSRDLETQHKAS